MRYLFLTTITLSAYALPAPDVTLPYVIEHYEAPAPVAPAFEMPRHWQPGDDHGHHGQVPEPGTLALIGAGLGVVAIKKSKLCNK